MREGEVILHEARREARLLVAVRAPGLHEEAPLVAKDLRLEDEHAG